MNGKLNNQTNKLFSQVFLNQISFNHLKLEHQSQNYSSYSLTGNGHGPFVELSDGTVKYDFIQPNILGKSHPLLIKRSILDNSQIKCDKTESLKLINSYFKEALILNISMSDRKSSTTSTLQLFRGKKITEQDTTFLSPTGKYITLSKQAESSSVDKTFCATEQSILKYFIRSNLFSPEGRMNSTINRMSSYFKYSKDLSFYLEDINLTEQLFDHGIICSYQDNRNIFNLPLSITLEHINQLIEITNKLRGKK